MNDNARDQCVLGEDEHQRNWKFTKPSSLLDANHSKTEKDNPIQNIATQNAFIQPLFTTINPPTMVDGGCLVTTSTYMQWRIGGVGRTVATAYYYSYYFFAIIYDWNLQLLVVDVVTL